MGVVISAYASTHCVDDAPFVLRPWFYVYEYLRENHSNADALNCATIGASFHSEIDREAPCAFSSQRS